ncbi:MAG: class I SAM-dependent methyltransferase [Candidatus Obscuribacterales bacterium]|nr:class I SAM-dependent methyltransferase [Candidatus Obscuribacterales bacterium]
MRSLNNCLACGSQEMSVVYEATYTGPADGAGEYFLNHRRKVARGRIVRCKQCRFLFTNPQFTADEYQQIYALAAREAPAQDPMQVAENLRFDRLASLVQKHAGRPDRLLDLGCGDGQFLTQVQAQEKVGYEVGGLTERIASGIKFMFGDFIADAGKAQLTDRSFSVVTAWDVLEHLPDLDRYIDAVSRLLVPGGLMFVTIPDADSFIARISGSRWNMLLLEHLWFFNRDNFERFMKHRGFTKVEDGPIPFAVSIAHLANRFSQTYGVDVRWFLKPFEKFVVSVPIGLIYAVYRRT